MSIIVRALAFLVAGPPPTCLGTRTRPWLRELTTDSRPSLKLLRLVMIKC